ncbi:hypothetical protein ABPG75_010455 [Micractinium tetrahymenae]
MASSIFHLLPFDKRHRTLPLVCRRWHALVAASPELRRQAELFLPSRRVLTGLSALAAWLRPGAAADVQAIVLQLQAPLLPVDDSSGAACAGGGPRSAASGGEEQQAGEALAAALADLLAACSGPSVALCQLDLQLEAVPLVITDQLAAALASVPRLQRLSISLHRYGGLRLAAPLAGLPALQELSLSARRDAMQPLRPGGPALPENAALQARCQQRGRQYCGGGGAGATSEGALAVGLELAALPRLHSLSLQGLRLPAQGYAPLARLPALRRLRLGRCRCHPSPACLAQLSTLEELHLEGGSPPATALSQFGSHPHGPDDEPDWRKAASRQLAQTLAHLPAMGGSLRRLVLTGHLSGLSAADLAPLAELCGLASLCIWQEAAAPSSSDRSNSGEEAASVAALPGGAWLSGLCQLAAPAQCLAGCQGFMRGASRLEGLAMQGCSAADAAWLADLLRWAAAHPVLRRLCLDLPASPEQLAAQGGSQAAGVGLLGRPGMVKRGDALACQMCTF